MTSRARAKHELLESRLLEIFDSSQLDMPVNFPGPGQQPTRIGQRCTAYESQFYAGLAQEECANHPLVAGPIAIGEHSGRFVHAFTRIRQPLS